MSEEAHSSSGFANHYPLPDDQFTYEEELQHDYAQRFPAAEPLMNAALDAIHHAIGIHGPRVKLAEPGTVPEGLPPSTVDEQGYLTESETVLDRLTLTMPADYSDEQIAAMSAEERSIASRMQSGIMIIGDIPPESAAMLEGIYSLIGAQVERDDRVSEEQQGVGLRAGYYHGEPVWVIESYIDRASWYDGQSVLSVMVVNEGVAKLTRDQLALSERQKFTELTGLNAVTQQALGVTRNNFEAMVKAAMAVAAAEDIVRKAKGQD